MDFGVPCTHTQEAHVQYIHTYVRTSYHILHTPDRDGTITNKDISLVQVSMKLGHTYIHMYCMYQVSSLENGPWFRAPSIE